MSGAQMTYKELASCLYPYVEGLAADQFPAFCRGGVRDVCRDTHLLNDLHEFEWSDEGEYRIDHSGFAFEQIIGMWVNNPDDFDSRLDAAFTQRVDIFDDYALLHFPDPEYYGKLFPNRLERKLWVRYALLPSTFGETFPAVLYEQNEALIRAAVLARLGPFAKEGNRRTSSGMTYQREYDDLVKSIRARNANNGFGPRKVPSMLNDAWPYRAYNRLSVF